MSLIPAPRRLASMLKAWRRAPEVLECSKQLREWGTVTRAYLGLGRPKYPLTLHFRNGDRLEVETYHDLVTVWVVLFRQEYALDPQASTIVDAGANIGTFALYAARRAPRAHIHALEPFPSTRERLLRTIRENGLEGRVTVHAQGLAGTSSKRFMQDAGPSQSRGTLASPGENTVAIDTVTLSQFVADAALPSGSMLKMDIEGAEHEVLGTADVAALSTFSAIALEYHPNGSRDALFQHLERSGFVLRHDRRDFRDSGVAHFERAPTA